MIVDARMVFLLLTAALLATLIGIAVSTLKKSRKKELEDPKHRMLEDD